MIPHIMTPTTLMFTNNEGKPCQVSIKHKHFDRIKELVTTSVNITADVWTELDELLTPAIRFTRIIGDYGTELEISDAGVLTCKVEGQPFTLPSNLSQYVLDLHEAKGDLSPLVSFVARLARNPRREVIDELWGFISACGLCLTTEGNFLAYKNVKGDFTSIYDSRTDNSPGTVLSMLRSNVEYDPNRTCSSGLHFAAWGYLQHYAHGSNTKTVLLEISPEDVVSIPSDYNNMKGRACRYKVLREVEQPEELKNRTYYDPETDSFDDEYEGYGDGYEDFDDDVDFRYHEDY